MELSSYFSWRPMPTLSSNIGRNVDVQYPVQCLIAMTHDNTNSIVIL